MREGESMDMDSINASSSSSAGGDSLCASSVPSASSSQESPPPAVIVALGCSCSGKSESYYLSQYAKLNVVKGRLSEKERLELLHIVLAAGDLVKRGCSFDAETAANAASSSLNESLRRQGVNLGDALKGMFMVYQDGASSRCSYSVGSRLA